MAFDEKQLLDEESELSAGEDDEFDDELTEETTTSDELTSEEPPQAVSQQLTESLEVKLTAEAGSISISLKRLLELSPGDILDVAALPPKVKLLVNNTVIGNGFLVELNGRIGVKITNLTGAASTSA